MSLEEHRDDNLELLEIFEATEFGADVPSFSADSVVEQEETDFRFSEDSE